VDKDSETTAWEYPEPAVPRPTGQSEPGAPPLEPQPPPASPGRQQVADDLLMLFGRLAGLILVVMVTMTAGLALFRPESDISDLATLLNTQLSLIIGAVLGYAAYPAKRIDR
jgi:hypothetical protein